MDDIYKEMGDEELLELGRDSFARTREVFGVVYERYHAGLFAFLKRYVGNAHMAEDILQETFLRAFRSLPGFRPEKRLSDWLYTIALNAARDLLRRKKSVPLDEHMTPVAGGISPAEASSVREEGGRLTQFVSELPDEERSVFILAKVEGRGLQEVADLLGFSLRTAKNRLADAMDHLSRRMSGMGVA